MFVRALSIGLIAAGMIALGTTAPKADEPKAATCAAPAVAPIEQTYLGRTFDKWMTEFRTEIDPARRIHSLKGLVMFGINGKAKEVTPLMLEVLDSYNLRAGLMLAESSADGGGEVEKLLEQETLPPGFRELGFMDVDDFRLFFAAKLGLSRLGARTTTQLVNYLEQPGEVSTGRIVAIQILALEANDEWLRILPNLATRSEMSTMIALHHWVNEGHIVDATAYEKCVGQMLELKSKPRLLQVVSALASDNHQQWQKTNKVLLETLAKKSTDEDVKAKVEETLAVIHKAESKYLKVTPVSAPNPK